MKITFKLFATLTDYLPLTARRANQIELDVAADATISQIIEPFCLRPSWFIWCWSMVTTSSPRIAPPAR